MILRGSLAMALMLAQILIRCGRIRVLARRRIRGTRATSAAATPAAMMTARMIHTSGWGPPPEPDGARKVPAAKGMATRNSRNLTTQLAVDAMAPELIAAAGS